MDGNRLYSYAPISVLKFERAGSRPILNPEALEAILSIGNGDIHTILLAVSGGAGCGKSTFQNQIVRCLLPSGQAFVPFEAGNQRDSVTEGIDLFDAPLLLHDPDDPTKSIKVILFDMQGSGIDVTGLLAEFTRLLICVSTTSTIVLHFTRSNSIQQSDVRGWAKDLYLLKKINEDLIARGADAAQQAESIIVVRSRSINLPAPETTPVLTQHENGPLCVNTPEGVENFGTDATGYVKKMLMEETGDGLESDKASIVTAFKGQLFGLLFPITANCARDLTVLERSFWNPVTKTLDAPADAPPQALDFVKRFHHYALAPLFRMVYAAHRRRLQATGGDENRPSPQWGASVVTVLNQLMPLLSGDWEEHVLVNGLVDVVLKSQLTTLSNERLGHLSQEFSRILEALLAGAYRTKREREALNSAAAVNGETQDCAQRLRESAARLTVAAQELIADWQGQSAAAMATAANPFTVEALGEGLFGAIPPAMLQSALAQYTEDARVLMLEITAELMRSTDEALREASERFGTASAEDQACAAKLEQVRREVEESTRRVKAEMAAREEKMRSDIRAAAAASQQAAKGGGFFGGLVAVVVAAAVVLI
jgi:hypothetical protein